MEHECFDRVQYKNGNVFVIYEDNHVIGVVKPAGILSQADDTDAEDMLTLIKKDIAVRYQKPGDVFLGLVHRLDRNTGGVMIFAKTSKGASRLSEELRAKRFHKGYFVLVAGSAKIARGGEIFRDKLEKDEKTNTVKASKNGKDCLLYAEKLAETEFKGEKYSLCFAVPITGRTHQIRVQFALRGMHLLGDVKYGGRAANGFLGLFSGILFVKHPTKDVQLRLAMSPVDFANEKIDNKEKNAEKNFTPWQIFSAEIYNKKLKEIENGEDFETLWKHLI